jgi:hypothetical protein
MIDCLFRIEAIFYLLESYYFPFEREFDMPIPLNKLESDDLRFFVEDLLVTVEMTRSYQHNELYCSIQDLE